HPPPISVVLVERAVDLGRDPPHHRAVAPRQEVLRLAVLEERIHPARQKRVALDLQWRDPRRSGMQPERELDELAQRAQSLGGPDVDRGSDGGPDCHRRESTGGEGYPASAGAGNDGSTRSRRAGRWGSHQFQRPNSDTTAGTSSARITVASSMIPAARPVAKILTWGSGPEAMEMNARNRI